MKEKIKGVLIGMVLGATLLTTAYATMGTVTKELLYNNIKISIDGSNIDPTDVNGNYVEPFIIDGTTYLPVRGIANALGFDVDWNGESNTVVIKNKEVDTDYKTVYADYIPWESDNQYMAVIDLNCGPYEYWQQNRSYYIDKYFGGLSENDRYNINHYSNGGEWGVAYLVIPRYKTTNKIVGLEFNWDDVYNPIETSEVGTIYDGNPFTVLYSYHGRDGGPIFRVYSDGKECFNVYENLCDEPGGIDFSENEVLDITEWQYYYYY